MKIELISQQEVIERIRAVKLRGHGQVCPYADAEIKWEHGVFRSDTTCAQNYVLRPKVELIGNLIEKVENDFELNMNSLGCGLLIDGIPFLPPILEGPEMLVCDGMHRVMAHDRRAPGGFAAIHIINPSHPYYAYPLEGGWDYVRKLDEIPTAYVKKNYREPADHKALFRDFNAQFPGIQEKR